MIVRVINMITNSIWLFNNLYIFWFIEKEFKTLGAEVLETAMPFDELEVLKGFRGNINK